MTFSLDKFVTEDTIQTVSNGKGPSFTLMSLAPGVARGDGKVTTVSMVIGAREANSCASLFGKKDLIELAEMILAIADQMDAYDNS
jgi:hypothetical protein